MRNRVLALGLLAGLVSSSAAFAQDQFFKIEMSGLEHCANFDNFKFNARNNVDMWLRIIDDQEWDLSTDPIFIEETTIPIIGTTYAVSSKKLSFIGAQTFGNGFLSIDGSASLDKTGTVTKVSGTFIQDTGNDPNSPNDPNDPSDANNPCTSSGKFKSTERTVVPP